MDRKLICFVFVALLVASMVDATSAAQPQRRRQRRWGKRNSQVGLESREYCARAKMICSPEVNGFNDEAEEMDINAEEN